ncbi:MAG: hypothetical protein JXQ87_16885 [Bacteroidia bacterium]
MKLKLLILPFAVLLLSMKPEVLKIEDVYEDPENLMLRSEVIELPGKTLTELKAMVENWGETSLANTKEYWADKSESSVKFSFLMPYETAGLFNTTVTVHYYIVFLVEYKEGKVRYKMYDDGNAYEPPTENTKERLAKSYYYKDFFGKDGEIENKGLIGKLNYRLVNDFNTKVIATCSDFKAEMLGEKEGEDDDW